MQRWQRDWNSSLLIFASFASFAVKPVKQKGTAATVPFLVPNRELADVERLGQPESEPALGHKSNFLFARGISSGCASGCANRRANDCALATSDQSAQQCASASASADESQIAFLIAAAADKHAIGLERHAPSIHRHERERNAQIAGIVQMS